MLKKIKNIIAKIDHFFFKIFGSDKSVKFLENLKEARTIFACLKEGGEQHEVRFVGGCVRRALCGDSINDIDLATSLTPDEMKKELDKKNIKFIETGIAHGTLTAILNKKKFEITTLRKDISTDGRHAKVTFTKNWKEDAARRDFTINAIYADIDGRIFDPLNGISDLKNGKVKFIGLAEDRIQEDYLRILRYFRFFSQYSKIEFDQATIQAIKKNVDGLNKISNERIFDELKKILSLANIYKLFSHYQIKDIILNIFPQFRYYERLNKISDLKKELRNQYDIYLVLALLIVDDSNNYEYFCHKYKASNRVKERFTNIQKNFQNLKNKKFYSEENIKKLIYFSSKKEVNDLLLFSACVNSKVNNNDIKKLINYVNRCVVPKFPISGDDLKKYGYKSGRILGQKLKFLEEKWIENNFSIDKNLIEKSLDNIS